jgi:DNA-binding transcriptional ArsR family regulator
VFQLNFGVADIANVRFTISPMDQLVSGAAQPGHPCVGASVKHDRWWRQVRRHVPDRAAPLLELVNASFEGVPDFLAAHVEGGLPRLTDELDAVLAVPDTELYEVIAWYEQKQRGVPRIIAELRDGDTRQLRRIADGAWSLYRACVAPDWPDIQRLLKADLAQRSRTMAEEGIGAMLARLHPQLTWQEEGTLRYATPEWEASFDLGGRGLELRPNFFLQGPFAVIAERCPPMMGYPICTRPPEYTATRRTDSLADLIGPARARALRAIAQSPCTTSQLAERLGVTAPSASAHATALRAASAITTEREGRQVRHSLTQLGHDLLRSNPDPRASHPDA